MPNMTVAKNIMLGRWPTRFGLISAREQTEAAHRALALVAPDLSPNTLARRLSPALADIRSCPLVSIGQKEK